MKEVYKEDLVIKLLIVVIIIFFSLILKLSFTGFFVLEAFNDTTTTGSLSFTEGGVGNVTLYVSLYSGINVSVAYINLTGLSNGYSNQSDGFYLDMPNFAISDIVTNGSDFWILAETQVFHYNSSFDNQSDGQDISASGVGTGVGITTNRSDFWINDINDDVVYHFNRSWDNQSDSFRISGPAGGNTGAAASQGIATNVTLTGGSPSDFWVIDDADNFVYHFNSSGDNQTDGFSVADAGVNTGRGIVWNGSDFWISDASDDFVYHFNSSGDNQTDGFSTALAGAKNLEGITYNGSDFWGIDASDYFVYHFARAYPSDTSLDVGNDSVFEWNHTGIFTLEDNKTKNFASAINDYLASCTLDTNGNCTVPFVFSSAKTGTIRYSAIRIDYNDTQAPSVSLSPSSNQNNLAIGSSISISCSASDNIGNPSVSVTIGGGAFCSGVGSCSGTYTVSGTGNKIVECTADDGVNSASSSITLSSSEGGSSGGGGPSSGPAKEKAEISKELVPITEEIKESVPLEILSGIEQIHIENIVAEVVDDEIIVSLEDQASLAISFEVGERPKPRLDMKFSTKDVPVLKQEIVEIRYFDWYYYFNILLFFFIIILIGRLILIWKFF